MRCALLFFLALHGLLMGHSPTAQLSRRPSYLEAGSPPKVQVHNRILTTVNGKPISVRDIQKKLDLIFYREFPQFADNSLARYQFYRNSWSQVFSDLVDKELILSDAERLGLEIQPNDVRKEMQELFGPNMMQKLDELDIAFDEAWEMVQTDITLRRMMVGRVNIRAIAKVHPRDVRKAYDEYLRDFGSSSRLRYRLVTIRSADEKVGHGLAEAIHTQLEGGADLDNSVAIVMSNHDVTPDVSTKVSESYEQLDGEVSPEYLEVLQRLTPGSISEPIAQKSRATGKTVYRLFFLEDRVTESPEPFENLEQQLNDQLMDLAVTKETQRYLAQLRDEFHIDKEALPENFEPFTLN